MSKSKGARIIITLECTCQKLTSINKRKPGTFRYSSTKNRKNTPNRIELMKFCPNCNKHTKFREIK
uniref:Large ribosomal subunit protein bL33c n=1 Tax=Gracilaria vermiculophylla TaxID=2608709 RepID=A0A345U8Z6_9FLOR|nr:ribosomal protein L33 [Gracilaria vermiculophylla]AXI96932.1 ribosomal protein L33 [Gracilaria vermiculophylla]QXU75137.1 ribosomal protein L33 [Gracilaria vermiculophylla]WDZ68050.1 ribosomal protein L33 [Gracilaria vermiculophylla]